MPAITFDRHFDAPRKYFPNKAIIIIITKIVQIVVVNYSAKSKSGCCYLLCLPTPRKRDDTMRACNLNRLDELLRFMSGDANDPTNSILNV